MEAPEKESLEQRARAISFFALAKHLVRRLAGGGARIGELGPALQERIRFRHDPSPVFHASDVAGLELEERDGRPAAEITTTFLGLVGAASPLANFATENLLCEEIADSASLRDFYDIFHHRLASLLYRVHLRAAPLSEARLDGQERVSARSLASSGLASTARASAALTPREWLGVARVLGRRPRSRAALEAALRLALPHLSFQVTDFLPRGRAAADGRRPRMTRDWIVTRPGQGARPGPRLHAERVRLVVGPVDGPGFQRLLPTGPDFERLRAVVRATFGARVDAELEIEIEPGGVPRARMSRQGGARFARDSLVLRPEAQRSVRARLRITDDAGAVRAVYLVSRT
jgi:type VI secretion system protein ImpH